VTFSPRSLEAQELVEHIKLNSRLNIPEEQYEPTIDRLETLLKQVEEERRRINSAIVAGAMCKKLLPISKWQDEFSKAPEPLRSHLIDYVEKGDHYEVDHNCTIE